MHPGPSRERVQGKLPRDGNIWGGFAYRIYTVFQKNGHPFYFFHNSLKWWSIYTKFLPDVAEEMLIQNI